ncbi:1,2-phenylacetyl-CoA epoxidase subunit PaaD [Paraburkholderia hayleyella]|uniref:1,2-phenylacetyl-CoA epoxidase subunit PaaD n=1 Tax=Paraburkholderia hayleyella TaxID=2152889 RepID=UPI00129233B2|nr:1,2-phenylacetyl-CoA epoxidase subunit PaaD [Paraburkholderia hayleyella]
MTIPASTYRPTPPSASTATTTLADRVCAHVWAVLETVPDPEIPVVSLRELGILRDVRRAADGALEIVITPTYSGCPAIAQIAEDIGTALNAADLPPYRIVTALAPAWTTDWITPEARAKLHAYGIAPPACNATDPTQPEHVLHFAPRTQPIAPACPRCGAMHTERLTQFGSTACKALYRCLACREPFDYFKPY